MNRVATAVAAATAAVVAWALWFEPRRIVLRRRTLRLSRWPAQLDGLRVAVVSDLHAGAPHVDAAKVAQIARRVNRARPDLVLLLGDYVDPDVPFATPLAPEEVARRLGALRAPLGVVAVLGNHDWRHDAPRIAGALRDAGITVLENAAVAREVHGRRLWIAGLADAGTRVPSPVATLDTVPDGEPVLVLSHDPDVFPRIPARAALTVSGHTHAGQVALPLLRSRYIPSRFGARFAGGHVVEGGRHLFVSAGVGTSRFPIRLLAPPEVVILRLVSPGR